MPRVMSLGVSGLDEVLAGGVRQGQVLLVEGVPGQAPPR